MDREFFEFIGVNVFSWSTKSLTEDQKEDFYKMICDGIIKGVLIPKQKLPDKFHNLILAEAIKGNRKDSLVKYLSLTQTLRLL